MRSCRFPNRDGTSDEMPPHVLHRRDEWRVIYSILLPSFTAAISYVARLETDNKNEGRPSLIDSRGLLHSLVLDVLQVHCCRNPSQGPRACPYMYTYVYVSPFLRVISAFLACLLAFIALACACLRLLALACACLLASLRLSWIWPSYYVDMAIIKEPCNLLHCNT